MASQMLASVWLLFMFELGATSPVYNMQPAFITANIGSSGRNIRHLPCVSKKSGLQGTCMFAIDCLKANGTHLGTCIDRFYFGSCCHMVPSVSDIDNVIDTALIPVRQPPYRLSSTTKKPSNLTTTTTNVTRLTTAGTTKPTVSTTLSTRPSSTSSQTKKPEVSSSRLPVTSQQTTSVSTTEKLTTVQFTSTTQRFPPRRTTTPVPTTTTEPPRLSTFQSVENSETTLKPSRGTQRPTRLTTVAPKTTTTTTVRPRPRPTSRPTSPPKTTPKPQRTTTRTTPKPTPKPYPTKTPTKPLKPTATITRVTTKPPVKPTKAPTRPVTNFTQPTTTQKLQTTPVTTESTKLPPKVSLPPETTVQQTTSRTTQHPTTIIQLLETTQLHPNEIFPTTSRRPVVESVSGNPATNEIEPEKPVAAKPETKPEEVKPEEKPEEKPETTEATTQSQQLVTWAIINEGSNQTSTEPDDWMPITTPDGWVLIPSVSTGATEPGATQPSNGTTSSATETTPETTLAPNTTFDITTTTPNDTRPTPKPANMSDFTDVCGRRMYPEGRIVGGDKSTFGRWPWQISLRQWKTSTYLHKCGAALLNENWAITAAHCVDNVPPSDLLLRLGEHDLSTDSEPHIHQERRVQIVASHPQFDPRTFEYDLALLRFYEPVTFKPNIIPVCVPQTEENFVGKTAYVTGWGRLYEDGPLPSVLQEVTVPVIENSVCEAMYRNAGYIEHIPNIFICAGWRRGGFDSCEGDSGGPMVIQRKDKRFLLAGIISWGIGCAEPNQPGVYTRISEFRDWINQILQF